MMILRRHVRRTVAQARAAHAAGDFAAARRMIEPVVVMRGAPLEAVRGMAELESLLDEAATGLPIAGLISHHFLRRYRWTIDFARMSMWFEGPAVGGSPR